MLAAERRTARFRWILVAVVEVYLTATVLGYLFGPMAKPRVHLLEILSFVAVFQLALLVGFGLGERIPIRWPSRYRHAARHRRTHLISTGVLAVIAAGSLISILFSYASLAVQAGSYSPMAIVQELARAFADPGASYARNRDRASAGSPLTAASVLLAPLWFPALPLALYQWRRVTRRLRTLVVVDGLLQAGTAVARGQNFGVFRVLLLVGCVLLLATVARRSRSAERARLPLRMKLALGAALTLFVAYFLMATGSRVSTTLPPVIAGVPISYDSGIMTVVPDRLKVPVALLFLYVCQGYYGFTHVVEIPFHTTWGLGGGHFTMDNFRALTGIDLYPRTYVHRMESVWNEFENWHTAYTWFANDVSPWGVILVMGLLGLMTSLILRGALVGEPLAIALAPLYLLMLAFLPMNNVVISNPLTCMPFVVLNVSLGVMILRTHLSRPATNTEHHDRIDGGEALTPTP